MIKTEDYKEREKRWRQNGIAIVGMGMRFPNGAESPESFCEILRQGKDCVGRVPKERWNSDDYYDKEETVYGTIASDLGGFLTSVDQFDAEFFHISAEEAKIMDPQQRILLEVVWEALEEGGQVPSHLRGKNVGVFIGAFSQDYYAMNGDAYCSEVNSYTATGISNTLLANRISYFYDWRGPSITLDTACSSSLTSVNQACESLLLRQCDVAAAGGVMLMLQPDYGVIESQAGFLSKAGHCKTFDVSADGYVRGEGAGVVILKRLEDAILAGDRIEGVILGSGVNQDGYTDTVTKPKEEAQRTLMEQTLKRAGVLPEMVSYIEAHGTGTKIGDVTEAAAIGSVYGHQSRRLAVGSVKTNLGHLESAAGIAGLIKVLLMLRYKMIVPNLHFHEINPNIPFAKQNIYVPITAREWRPENGIRMAAVNSFGFGGTNAHVIVAEPWERWGESADVETDDVSEEEYHLLQISAASESSLEKLRRRYYDMILSSSRRDEKRNLSALEVSTFDTREWMQYRSAYVYRSKEELLALLSEQAIKGCQIGTAFQGKTPLVFVYSGMGPQWYGMGRELYQKNSCFYHRMQECIKVFEQLSGRNLECELTCEPEVSQMEFVEVGQPMHVMIQIALTDLLLHYGIKPDYVIGHSAGEMAAFYAAGIYSLSDTLTIAYHRSRCLGLCYGMGKMLAADLTVEEALKYVEKSNEHVYLACINAENAVTFAGTVDYLEQIHETLAQAGIRNQFLNGDIPYHSPLLKGIESELLMNIRNIKATKETIPILSTVYGKPVHGEEVQADYWWKNVSYTVRFDEAVKNLMQRGCYHYIEIGAHPVLLNYIARHETSISKVLVPTLRRQQSDIYSLTNALAKLFVHGHEFDPKVWFGNRLKDRVSLPHYAWKHSTYWVEPEIRKRRRLGIREGYLLGIRQDTPSPVYENLITMQQYSFLTGHQVMNQITYPAAAYLEMYYEAAELVFGTGNYRICDISLIKAVRFGKSSRIWLRTEVQTDTAQIISYYKEKDNDYVRCATARLQKVQARTHGRINLNHLQSQLGRYLNQENIYELLQTLQFEYRDSFQTVKEAWYEKDVSMARIQVPNWNDNRYQCQLPPECIDGCFQALLIADSMVTYEEMRIPVSIQSVEIWGQCTESIYASAYLRSRDSRATVGDVDLYNDQGKAIGRITGMRRETVRIDGQFDLSQWIYEPVWKPVTIDTSEKLVENQVEKQCDSFWLILGQSSDLTFAWKERLTEAGIEPLVLPPERFIEAFEKGCPEQIVYVKESTQEPECMNSQVEAETFLHLLQSILKRKLDTRVWLVTKGMFSVLQEEHVGNPMDAAFYGIYREYAQQENPSGAGGSIDYSEHVSLEEMADWTISYIRSNPNYQEIAVRTHQVYVRKITKVRKLHPFVWHIAREDETVLIVGAYGAIGRIITESMIESGVKKFVFLAHRKLTEERKSWLKSIRMRGISIMEYTADIRNEEELTQCISEILKDTKLTGVIIASGIVRDCLMEKMTLEQYREVYETKAIGVWNLHKSLPHDLDYFLVCSSIASYLPGLGQANYSAANCTIDAICQYRRQCGLPAVSMNWGPWSIGMVNELTLNQVMVDHGWILIDPLIGKRLFQMALQTEKEQVILAGMNLGQLSANDMWHFADDTENIKYCGQTMLETLMQLELPEKKQKLRETLFQILSSVSTNKESVYDLTKSLSYYGVDSLGALFIREQLSKCFGVNVLISELLGSLDIRQLIELISARVEKNI